MTPCCVYLTTFFQKPSRPALALTQPLVKLILEIVSLQVRWPVREPTIHLHSQPTLSMYGGIPPLHHTTF